MRQLVLDELASSIAGAIKQFQGKLVFATSPSRIFAILDASLVERVFWCILCTELLHLHDGPSLLSSVRTSLNNIDWTHYFRHRHIWLDQILPAGHNCDDKNLPLDVRLFVKLRPKWMIRYTKAVHETTVRCLTRPMMVNFCNDAALEANLMVSNAMLFLLLPLTRKPLSLRDYIPHPGLRSTSASALVRDIKEGTLLDPMCGKGVLLCEAVMKAFKRSRSDVALVKSVHCFLLGTDCSAKQLHCARENLIHIQTSTKAPGFSWDLIQCFTEYLPFRDGIFDNVVCDMPFGKKHGVCSHNSEVLSTLSLQNAYTIWLSSIKQNLCSGGKLNLLVGEGLSEVASNALQKLRVQLTSSFSISLGTSKAVLLSGFRYDSGGGTVPSDTVADSSHSIISKACDTCTESITTPTLCSSMEDCDPHKH
ncbi:unnamed protein product [Dicrocoelium dendriticum]|nr:unnamed protein product [Dicrocoelium dendriticum]